MLSKGNSCAGLPGVSTTSPVPHSSPPPRDLPRVAGGSSSRPISPSQLSKAGAQGAQIFTTLLKIHLQLLPLPKKT